MGNPSSNLTWLEFDTDAPARPGQINLKRSNPRDDPRYIDRAVTAVGYSIYIGGYHVFCADLNMPVFVPESMVDPSMGAVREASNQIYDNVEEARSTAAAIDPQPGVAYFMGAGGTLVVPTVICPATAPRLVATMLEARKMLSKAVAEELSVLATSLVGGMVVRAVISRIVGVKRGNKLPPQTEEPVKIRAKNDKINVGGALEEGSNQYTNLNPVNPNSGGAAKGIPNHVQAPFEKIGEIFQPDTVREIVSYRLRYVDIKDWPAAARGSLKVLRPGGKLSMNVWADAKEVAAMIKVFVEAGFKEVGNVGMPSGAGVIISAIKA